MARIVRDAKLDSRTARLKLAQQREPYWIKLSAGCYVGYRKGSKAGSWIARFRGEDKRQHYEALGGADDNLDDQASGLVVLTYEQAQQKARSFFEARARQLAGHAPICAGPYTVEMALQDYFNERERRGSKGLSADRSAARARIVPVLGASGIQKLTTKAIRDWLQALEKSPKFVRTRPGLPERQTKVIDRNDPDAVRARKATANRVLTILKAALNFAFHEGKVASDEPWRKVKPYREADAPVIHYLRADECVRLVNACQGPFRDLVRGALLTGCRYGELTRMKVADFNADTGAVTVRISKSGKARHVALNDEGCRAFRSTSIGRGASDFLFARVNGKPWAASHQQRPLAEAAAAARIDPAPTFHILRHTYASMLAMGGVSMRVIADQLGHADTRVTERHYARLAPSYVTDVVRASLPSLGISETSLGASQICPIRDVRQRA